MTRVPKLSVSTGSRSSLPCMPPSSFMFTLSGTKPKRGIPFSEKVAVGESGEHRCGPLRAGVVGGGHPFQVPEKLRVRGDKLGGNERIGSTLIVSSALTFFNTARHYCVRSCCTTAPRKSKSSIAFFPVGFGRAPSPTITTLFLGFI